VAANLNQLQGEDKSAKQQDLGGPAELGICGKDMFLELIKFPI